MKKIRESLPDHLKNNPFFEFSAETLYVPAWHKIRPEHMEPAIDYALKLAEENVRKIRDNHRNPTFRNTVEALEEAAELVGYFLGIIYNLIPDKEDHLDLYEEMQKKCFLKYYSFWEKTFQDDALYIRVRDIKNDPSFKKFTAEKKYLHEMYVNAFIDQGIKLSPEKRSKLSRLKTRLMDLGHQYQQNIKDEQRDRVLVVDDRSRLAGLSPFVLAAAAEKARKFGHEGRWVFGIGKDSYGSFMQSAQDRDLRRQMWELYHTQATKGARDSRPIVLEMADLQRQAAQMVGYRNAAHLNTTYNMVRNIDKIDRFLSHVRRTARPVADEELKILGTFARKEDGLEKIEPWDLRYYQARLKKEVMGFDDEDERPYFELEHTLKGAFTHFENLLGISFEEVKDHNVYHGNVRAFDVRKKRTGEHLGVVFMDLLAHPGKPPGTAWSARVLAQGLFEGQIRRPVDVIVMKLAHGKKGDPVLMTHTDVTVLFHELGHCAHNMLSRARYASMSGTSVSNDFVEFPSQVHENWTYEPEILSKIARHHKTGQPMPDHMIDGISNARKFMGGIKTLRMATKGWLDLAWSRVTKGPPESVEDFEEKALKKFRIMPHNNSLLSTHFAHIFGGGYETGFYSYQWDEQIDADVFAKFKKSGDLYDRSLSSRFRKVLETGDTGEYYKMVYSITRHRLTATNFLNRHGLLRDRFNYGAAGVAANDNEKTPEIPATKMRTPKPAVS